MRTVVSCILSANTTKMYNFEEISGNMAEVKGIFDRTERLIGSEGLTSLGRVSVIVIGVGGVGSWCAEGLVRSGISHLTLVDSDNVCASNVNRQLMATTLTIGRPKVDVLRERLLEINPDAVINVSRERFCLDTADSFQLDQYDYVVDAIDSIPDKALLILLALQTKATLFSSMGSALKLDPSRIAVAEFWNVKGCPLARALRNHFKKNGQFPSRKFQCVYSEERLENQPVESGNPADTGNGTCVFITATFGFRLAAMVVNHAILSD